MATAIKETGTRKLRWSGVPKMRNGPPPSFGAAGRLCCFERATTPRYLNVPPGGHAFDGPVNVPFDEYAPPVPMKANGRPALLS